MCNTERTEMSKEKFIAQRKTHIFEPYGQTFSNKNMTKKKIL
jgi:hypothetical protein